MKYTMQLNKLIRQINCFDRMHNNSVVTGKKFTFCKICLCYEDNNLDTVSFSNDEVNVEFDSKP